MSRSLSSGLSSILEWTFIGNGMYGPLLEIERILIIHNNCIFPYYGYCIEIVWIYCGFSGAIANLIVWISHFSPVRVVCMSASRGYGN